MPFFFCDQQLILGVRRTRVYNNRIQMIPAASGTYFGQAMTAAYIYTIVGSSVGTAGVPSSTGTLASSTNITSPDYIAVDSNGNLFFHSLFFNGTSNIGVIYMVPVATGNFYNQAMTANKLYRVATSGTTACYMTVDKNHNLYYFTGDIMMIPYSSGTYFGQSMTKGTAYNVGPNTVITSARPNGLSTASESLVSASQITVDPSGNIIAPVISWSPEYSEIYLLTSSAGTFYGQSMSANLIYTIAGSISPGSTPASTGNIALGSPISSPNDVTYDKSGNLYILDVPTSAGPTLQMVPLKSGSYFGISMTAGKLYTIGSVMAAGSNIAMAIDSYGNVISGGLGLWALASSTGTFYGQAMTMGQVYEIAGAGANSGNGVTLPNVKLTQPTGVGVDSAGNLYVTDDYGVRIVMIPKNSGTYFGQSMTANKAYTIAGGSGSGTAGIGGLATAANLAGPNGAISIDSSGNVFFADDNRLLVIAASNTNLFGQAMLANHLYIVAGAEDDTQSYLPVDGVLATSGAISSPVGVTSDSLGNLYFSSTAQVRMVPRVSGNYFGQSMTAGYIYTLNSPSNLFGYSSPRTLIQSAYFNRPYGLAIDSSGNVIVADGNNNAVEMIGVAQ